MASLGSSRARWTFVVLAMGAGLGCPNLHIPGPEDPPQVPVPRLVSVTIEYRQPNGCVTTSRPCDLPVEFFGSWMRDGGGFRLDPDPGSHVWRGVALAVPVNFPPRDVPYEVRIFDPFLRDTTTGGYTAQRLKVGSEAITRIETPGGYDEHGLVYIDDNGLGRSPF